MLALLTTAAKEAPSGLDHPDDAQTRYSVGLVYANKGTYDEALSWCRKALASIEKTQDSEY